MCKKAKTEIRAHVFMTSSQKGLRGVPWSGYAGGPKGMTESGHPGRYSPVCDTAKEALEEEVSSLLPAWP